jgi:hypothetical protein
VPKNDRGELPSEWPARAAKADPDRANPNGDTNSDGKSPPEISVRAF